MSSTARGPAVVDTNVFGARLRTRTYDLAARYDPVLVRRKLYISFQTVAELEFGAMHANWGDLRRRRLASLIRSAEIVWVGDELVRTYAQLRLDCHRAGHPLAQPHHNGDLWIASTALRLEISLVSNDGIFDDVPGLTVERA